MFSNLLVFRALRDRLYAIKKFKADKEGGIVHYTGISQSACREMALCREMNHNNVINLIDVFLEDKSIFIIFDYAEHDLLQIIHYHTHPDRKAIPESIIKSVLWQILNGVSYLHQNWVLHRDLKPANIMLSSDGVVKIGDLGLARLFSDPLQTLYSGDKIVVTIWYRAPELLLGARHYTPAIDLWAVGCILGELLALKPIFKGEEAKLDNKKQAPFPRSQFQKVIDVLGSPTVDKWPSLPNYPEFQQLQAMKKLPSNVTNWYQRHVISQPNPKAFNLFTSLLEYDPAKRITADDTLSHEYFRELPRVTENVFAGQNYEYPSRRISNDDNNIKATNNNNNNSSAYQTATNKRQAANDYSDPLHSRKKQR